MFFFFLYRMRSIRLWKPICGWDMWVIFDLMGLSLFSLNAQWTCAKFHLSSRSGTTTNLDGPLLSSMGLSSYGFLPIKFGGRTSSCTTSMFQCSNAKKCLIPDFLFLIGWDGVENTVEFFMHVVMMDIDGYGVEMGQWLGVQQREPGMVMWSGKTVINWIIFFFWKIERKSL